MNISVASTTMPIGSSGNRGWRYGRSDNARPCAWYAHRKRSDMSPMEPHTNSAEMPVRFSSHVKTTPSPQIVVRNVRKDTASETLHGRGAKVHEGEIFQAQRKRGVQESGDGNAALVDPAENARRLPCPREREEHTRARIETRVARRQNRRQQDGINDVGRCTEPRAHEDNCQR